LATVALWYYLHHTEAGQRKKKLLGRKKKQDMEVGASSTSTTTQQAIAAQSGGFWNALLNLFSTSPPQGKLFTSSPLLRLKQKPNHKIRRGEKSRLCCSQVCFGL
jgi:hypothetical protein